LNKPHETEIRQIPAGKAPIPGKAIDERDQLAIVKGYLQRCVEDEVLKTLEKLQGSSGGNLAGNTLLRYELELRLEARQ